MSNDVQQVLVSPSPPRHEHSVPLPSAPSTVVTPTTSTPNRLRFADTITTVRFTTDVDQDMRRYMDNNNQSPTDNEPVNLVDDFLPEPCPSAPDHLNSECIPASNLRRSRRNRQRPSYLVPVTHGTSYVETDPSSSSSRYPGTPVSERRVITNSVSSVFSDIAVSLRDTLSRKK